MTEVKDITGYSHYLAMKSQMSGMLVYDGHKATSEETSLRQECRRMSDRISLELSVCKEEESPCCSNVSRRCTGWDIGVCPTAGS